MIFDELEYDFARPPDAPPDEDPLEDPSTAQSETDALRTKLLPLVAIEDSFASELNGGISVSGGRTGVFVRAGWQGLVAPSRGRPLAAKPSQDVATLVAKNLSTLHQGISDLWQHPAVKRLLRLRKLRLDESAPLSVFFPFVDQCTRLNF